jgi:DNA mismatch endonuclease, patch repair protein
MKTKARTYIRDGRAPIPQKEITSRIMSSIRAKDTKPELLLRKALWKAGLRGYRLHWEKASGRPDICYPSKKIAIFVHGCFWHRCPHCKQRLPKAHKNFWVNKFKANKERDQRKLRHLGTGGWDVVVFWECEIINNAKRCAGKVASKVKNKSL